tara:strand:+ start:9210 stop:9398 length:189 start_codon:yes stop_codon:yes gene_type:complete
MVNYKLLALLFVAFAIASSCRNKPQEIPITDDLVVDLDPSLFVTGTSVSIVPCTLSNGISKF